LNIRALHMRSVVDKWHCDNLPWRNCDSIANFTDDLCSSVTEEHDQPATKSARHLAKAFSRCVTYQEITCYY